MRMMKWSTHDKKFAKSKFGGKFFPAWIGSTSDSYLCTTDKISSSHIIKDKGSRRAYSGKYVIAYHVQDRAGNKECSTARRTVIVKDLIPQVVTTHLREQIVGNKAAKYAQEIKKHSSLYGASPSHKSWPLFQVKSRFGGSRFMAEQASTYSATGWMIGASVSAVTGIALLGYAARKPRTIVPV